MIKLGVAPRLFDFSKNAASAIDSWFNQVGVRLNMQEKNGAPTISEVPENQWAFYKNTATSNVGLYVNDNGVLKSIASYANPLTISGGFSLNFNVTGNTNLTLPTSGTLVNTIGTGATGTWGISISGNAATATTATTATSATTAGSVTNAVTFNNGGAGAASGSTYNGAATLTVSYNTVGAPSTTGTGASGSWGISITGSSASTTGNAATATKLATARNINTVAFDGTADITVTAAAGTLTGTTLNATVVTSSLTTVGTIGTGTWQGTVLAGQFGGTGVANTGKTITLGGNLTTSGAFATTFTMTNTTTVTFPVTGTLATLAGSETFTNKTLTTPVIAQIVNTGTLTLPTATDTLVARTTTDTLTNKSLTSPTLTGTPVTPTAAVGTNTTQVASTAFVQQQLSSGCPIFSVYQSTLQALVSTVLTKIQFQTKEFDTTSAFDATTNYRWQPTTAGQYQINFMVSFVNAPGGISFATIYKNGVRYKDGSLGTSQVGSSGSALVDMNGTTDFIEIFAYQESGINQNTSASISRCYLNGFLARQS